MALSGAAPMETAQSLSSTSDLEQRVARIADPNIGVPSFVEPPGRIT